MTTLSSDKMRSHKWVDSRSHRLAVCRFALQRCKLASSISATIDNPEIDSAVSNLINPWGGARLVFTDVKQLSIRGKDCRVSAPLLYNACPSLQVD